MQIREKHYEAKDDAKQYFANGGRKDVAIHQVNIPGKNRHYLAVVQDGSQDKILSQFDGCLEEDYFRPWDF